MLGAIIGDIVGSRFEFANTNRKDFSLFASGCDYTDDTICTIAVADAILRGADYGETLHAWCRQHPCPKGSYGGRFAIWVHSDHPHPYGSFGNGSAMRVSPCGWLPSRQEVKEAARLSAICTHDHPEGIKGAVCIADLMYCLRTGMSKEEIRELATKEYGYRLDFTCDDLRRSNYFDETCQVTVPQAIVAFLESTDFEDAIRNAISIGGDSDTIGAICGALAEAHYDIPEPIARLALGYLTAEMRAVISQFYARYGVMG